MMYKRRACGDASRALLISVRRSSVASISQPLAAATTTTHPARREARRSSLRRDASDHATRGVRLRELRWKNSAWLATAETIAGWNGLEIKNAGSGRSPVKKRSG